MEASSELRRRYGEDVGQKREHGRQEGSVKNSGNWNVRSLCSLSSLELFDKLLHSNIGEMGPFLGWLGMRAHIYIGVTDVRPNG